MSNTFQLSSRSSLRRKAWGRLLGSCLRDIRIEKGRSVQEAAEAAGIKAAEWEAVEAGQTPEKELACQMGDALGADRSGMAALIMFCHEAWD